MVEQTNGVAEVIGSGPDGGAVCQRLQRVREPWCQALEPLFDQLALFQDGI